MNAFVGRIPIDQLSKQLQSIFEEMSAERGSAAKLTISVDANDLMEIIVEYGDGVQYNYTAQEV